MTRLQFPVCLYLPVVVLWLMSGGAQAQTPDTTRVQMPDVEVSVNRASAKGAVPFTRMEREEIERVHQNQDLFYTLGRLAPSVFPQSDNGTGTGYTYVRIRGLDQTRVNFTYNGIPMNEMEDQGLYLSNMPGFAFGVANVEVQRGVGTSKMGTTAFGGSVDMASVSSQTGLGRAEVSVGSFGTYRASGIYSSGPRPSGVSFLSGVSVMQGGGFRAHSSSAGGTYFGELAYRKGRHQMKAFGFTGRAYNQLAWLPLTRAQLDTNYRRNANAPEEKDLFHQTLGAVSYAYSGSRWHAVATAYLNTITGHYVSFLSPTLPGRFGASSYQTGAMYNAVGSFGILTLEKAGGLNLYRRFHSLTADRARYYLNEGTKLDFSDIYRARLTLGPIHIDGDVQWRAVQFQYRKGYEKQWIFLNPKLGVSLVRTKFDVYASASRAGREATRTDMLRGYDNVTYLGQGRFASDDYGDGSYPVVDTFQINARPERVLDLEAGIRLRPTRNLSLGLNAYRMLFRGEWIATGQYNYIGLPLREPGRNSLREGLELEACYKGWMEILATASVARNRADSVQTPNSPPVLANLHLFRRQGRFLVGASGQYVGASTLDLSGRLSSPEYVLVGAQIAYIRGGFMLRYMASNLLNRKYYLPAGSAGDVGLFYPGARRAHTVTCSLEW